MLKYDDITIRDLHHYWGSGYVLWRSDDKAYNLYTTEFVQVSRNKVDCNLYLAEVPYIFGNPERQKNMPIEMFYREVMLHRPPLGVLVNSKDGIIKLLSWQHADGNHLGKALLPRDVLVETIPSLGTEEAFPPLLEHWADCVYKWRANVGHEIERVPMRLQDHPVLREYLSHVALLEAAAEEEEGGKVYLEHMLSYLNQTPRSLAEAVAIDGPAFVRDTVWLDQDHEGKKWLRNGAFTCGVLDPDGRFTPDKTNSVYGLMGQTIVNQLKGEYR